MKLSKRYANSYFKSKVPVRKTGFTNDVSKINTNGRLKACVYVIEL